MGSGGQALRILTLNIWNLNEWEARRDELAAWLEYLDPDVIGLQEVIRSPDLNQDEWLADRAGYQSAYAEGMKWGDESVTFGLAVLSRFPITNTEVCRLTALDEPDEGRICLRADLETDRGLLTFFTTHLNWKFHHGKVREAQVREIGRFVVDRPRGPNPPILAGDFNADPESTEIRYVKGLTTMEGKSFYMQDAYEVARAPQPGFTWDNRNPYAAKALEPDRRIDYIFVGWRREDGAGRVLSSRVVCDRSLTGNWATDHLGLLAEIVWPRPASRS